MLGLEPSTIKDKKGDRKVVKLTRRTEREKELRSGNRVRQAIEQIETKIEQNKIHCREQETRIDDVAKTKKRQRSVERIEDRENTKKTKKIDKENDKDKDNDKKRASNKIEESREIVAKIKSKMKGLSLIHI